MENGLSRRRFLINTAGCLGGASVLSSVAGAPVFAESKSDDRPLKVEDVRFCLNLGTLRNYELGLIDELKVARDAGYKSVEIWFDRLADYAREDGVEGFAPKKLAELKKFIDGEGLTIEGAIGFASWIVDDENRRRAGLEELRRQAEALSALGAGCVAAPAAGANARIDLAVVAERFRDVIDLCRPFGVRPLLELWGVSPALHSVSDCLAICAATDREDAALLLDVYHMYRGGNTFKPLSLIAGGALPIFHMNDYPGEPEREKLSDGDRVFPGDGIAPMREILDALGRNGFRGALSFEIFNRSYRDRYTALEQARIGLEKMRALFD